MKNKQSVNQPNVDNTKKPPLKKKKVKKETTEEHVKKVINEAVSIIVTTIAGVGSAEYFKTSCIAELNGKTYSVEIDINEVVEVETKKPKLKKA